MPNNLPDALPVFSFDVGHASGFRMINVDYSRLSKGIEHLGLPAEIVDGTAVHFTDAGTSHFGTSYNADNGLSRLLSKIPGINKEYLDNGHPPHHHKFTNRIVINVGDTALTRLPSEFSNRLNVSTKKIRGLNRGDLLSMVLAHELHHRLPEMPGMLLRRNKAESRIDSYITDCLDMRQSNPWLGVIVLRRR